MIIGIGTDICEIHRIKISDKFAERILTSAELSIYNTKNNKQAFLAKRFSAKEAISKAFGCGIGSSLSFHDIEISNNENGKPIAKISDTAKEKLPEFSNIHLSLSDEKHYCVAFAIVENQEDFVHV